MYISPPHPCPVLPSPHAVVPSLPDATGHLLGAPLGHCQGHTKLAAAEPRCRALRTVTMFTTTYHLCHCFSHYYMKGTKCDTSSDKELRHWSHKVYLKLTCSAWRMTCSGVRPKHDIQGFPREDLRYITSCLRDTTLRQLLLNKTRLSHVFVHLEDKTRRGIPWFVLSKPSPSWQTLPKALCSMRLLLMLQEKL